MSDDKEDAVEAMSPQEVMDHQRRIQAREKGDPTNFLIWRGCKRAREEIVNNAPVDVTCPICLQVYSGSCFSLSACNHFFHRDCLSDLFDHRPTDKNVICPLCKGQYVTNGTEDQAQL